jgi:TolB-like protein
LATVFLSYAREDTSRVRPIVSTLERSGHVVWWDEQVAGGDQFTKAIQNALDKADVVMVAWTRTSIESAWVRDEAACGRDSGRLVPVTLDGCPPPLGFREYQSIDLSSWTGRPTSRQFEAVTKAIAAKAGERSSTIAGHRSGPAARTKRRWTVAAAAAAALVLAAVGLVTTGVIESPWAALRAQTPAIAVLPFADLSPAHDKAYFAEGVAEEILSSLGTEKGITVLGRTSASQIEPGADPKEVRRKLGVTHLLEGSARSAGDQLRVNVRLIDTSDGRRVWEEEYRGRLADIFAVQDRIAATVVQRLRGTLVHRQLRAAPVTNAEAYQAYLAARALMRTRNKESLSEAFDLAQQVIRSDPKYAPGQALVGELYYLLSDDYSAYGSIPIDKARPLGLAHARRAISLAPNAPEGYAALGLLSRGAAAVPPLQRAIELDPSRAELRLWLGFSLNEMGRHDEALAQYRAAAAIDPLGVAPDRFVHALAAAGQQQQAIEAVQRFVARGGDESQRYPMLVLVATWQADPSAVIAYGRTGLAKGSMQHHDYFLLFLASALNAVGKGKAAAAVLSRSLQPFHAPYYAGDMQQLRSNIDRAGPQVWKTKNAGFVFVHLARLRDWSALANLFDRRGFPFAEYCSWWPNSSAPFVMALRARGRAADAEKVLGCFRARLAVESRMRARLPEEFPGDLESRRASFSALQGDGGAALQWLGKAVDRGWLGQPYSGRLTDYPQFDALRADPRFAQLQRRIDVRIARERAELAAQERSAPLA